MATVPVDPAIQRLLNDKLYDKRKQGALELEKVIRDAVSKNDDARVKGIVDHLCHEYAYAVHQPYARNGGLIGLAAASIALGSDEVAPYLTQIVPPVLACFTDQDARVRYYACESMYNIAKVAKGEILLYFNDIFDALCKLASDTELSVKNGAELLDRLVKDIVSESAATYVSVLEVSNKGEEADGATDYLANLPTAFSLEKFIPLLKERIHVINPFTRNFLVSWLTLLDTIPDLELVSYLPAFLGGLFKFLSDQNKDVHTSTHALLKRFLDEIKKVAGIKKDIAESRREEESAKSRQSEYGDNKSVESDQGFALEASENAIADSESGTVNEDQAIHVHGDYVPGQDVHVDHPKILDILVGFVDTAFDEEIQLTALRWIDSFFEISPEDILQYVPRLLTQVLPALASDADQVRQAANRVNTSLMQYIVSLPDDVFQDDAARSNQPSRLPAINVKDAKDTEEKRATTPTGTKTPASSETRKQSRPPSRAGGTPRSGSPTRLSSSDLDYAAAVDALIHQFLNENEATRVAALEWLIMLHRKAPRKVLAFHDGTFPALLKTLSDPAEAVVTRDLQLLSQISRNSEDGYFTSFMENLLQLFSTDRKLLEVRGNLIIRQLCMNLSPERIYKKLADCIEKEEDLEFASIMVQNLNNNLITAPELADLRKRLRNLESKEGQTFFVALFRSWCHNAVATFSLCLLAQAYEQAYNLLLIFAELEMTVNMLIQIDKLVQLLESPVFTYLRLQLLEPEKHPYLYKCLYGVLMLLPQSSAFAALKNRLNSVSNIGLLHGPKGYVSSQPVPSPSRPSSPTSTFPSHFADPTMPVNKPDGYAKRLSNRVSQLGAASNASASAAASYERPTVRVKGRDEATGIRWVELLDKFKSVQERSRRSRRTSQFDSGRHDLSGSATGSGFGAATSGLNLGGRDKGLPEVPSGGAGNAGAAEGRGGLGASRSDSPSGASHKPPTQKQKSSLGNFGRLSGIGQRKLKK